MGVALGGGHSGVAEHLLNDPDVHTLLDEDCRGGVASVANPDVSDASLLKMDFQIFQSSVRSMEEPAWSRTPGHGLPIDLPPSPARHPAPRDVP
nr:hypothetical protein [Nonomuraea sp. WAC 01424]